MRGVGYAEENGLTYYISWVYYQALVISKVSLPSQIAVRS
jgi:hypothetical protein